MKKISTLLILLLTSCGFLPAVGENYKKPEMKMPKKWVSTKNDEEQNSQFADIEQAWWQNFDDPILNQLIAIAVENNYDFRIAQSRVVESRANVTSASSDLGPKVTAAASASRKNNYINPINPDNHRIFNLFTAGFDASWEIDLFGGNRRARQSAKALFEASTEEKNYVLISLIAEVAKNYAMLRDAQKQLFLQKQISESYQKISKLHEEKNRAGLLSDVDFNRIKIDLLNSQNDLANAQLQAQIAFYNLEALLAKKPGELQDFLGDFGEVPILRKEVIIAAPLGLLDNRPDVRQAERELESATALKGYAIAQIFPKISLSGFFGFYNTKSGNLLKSSSKVFSSAANINTPILDFGGVWAGMKMAEERKKQALLTYQSQVNKALIDVESSLINFVKTDEKLFLTLQTNELYQKIYQLNKQRYEQGIISSIEQLRLQIELWQSDQKLSQAKLDFTTQTIALYKSLGGGWKVFLKDEKK